MSDGTTPNVPTFTGRARRRTTRRGVKVADAVAKYGITIGGLAVVAALAALIVFLVVVVWPLFGNASSERTIAAPLPARGEAKRPVAMAMDDNLLAAWTLDPGGSLGVYELDRREGTLAPVLRRQLGQAPVTAVSESRGVVGLGLADGTVVVGKIDFDAQYPKDFPPELAGRTSKDPPTIVGEAVGDVTRTGRPRLTTVSADLSEPIRLVEAAEEEPGDAPVGEEAAVAAIDFIRDESGGKNYLVARRADGRTFWATTVTKQDMRTGETTTTLRKYELPRSIAHDPDAEVAAVLAGRNGTDTYVLFRDGHLVWYDTRDLARGRARGGGDPQPRIAGEFDTVEGDASVSAATMLLGDYTIIVADTDGGVAGWFPSQQQIDGETEWRVVKAHELARQPAAVTSIALSSRDRQFLTGDAQGNLWLRHMTSDTTQAQLEMPGRSGVQTAAIAPPLTALAAVGTDGTLAVWDVENPHADGKLPALFAPVHYEGREGPGFVWQSSAAGDAAEPKLSVVPLVWGTLKATLYAMLFATPVAILAAIYSSEFMQPRVRSVVKPSVEMMAGLPSVVLGYIAAQVLAPYAEDVLPGLLITFAAVPIGVMVFGFLWQLVPPSEVNRQAGFWALGGWAIVGVAGLLYCDFGPPLLGVLAWGVVAAVLAAVVLVKRDEAGPYMPFVVMTELVVASILVGLAIGPLFELLFFGGGLRDWLLGRPQGWVAAMPESLRAVPGWLMLLTPVFIVALVICFNLYVRNRLAWFDGRTRSRTQLAVADLLRFAVVGVAAITLAAVVGGALSLIGLDLRADWLGFLSGGVVDSSGLLDRYDQRNALIVGMIMGFAVIPIIYTVSEDALTAVPNTLRSAALGAGATPWQTAIRVVLPVALSGIFSACMIGLGRAVGETMIVLMAAGNTATMNLNLFDGMRTLSANIAVEMPEAPKDGTLYRVLFLSALVLFAMTFVVNTLAELVRIRFRKRAFQL